MTTITFPSGKRKKRTIDHSFRLLKVNCLSHVTDSNVAMFIFKLQLKTTSGRNLNAHRSPVNDIMSSLNISGKNLKSLRIFLAIMGKIELLFEKHKRIRH